MMLMTAPVSMAAIAYCGLPMLRWISFVSPRPSETLSMAAALSPKKEAQPPAHDGDGKNDAGSGVAQVADAIADKNLIDNIVKTGNDQGADTGNRELPQQFSYPFGTKILTVFHKMASLNSDKKTAHADAYAV